MTVEKRAPGRSIWRSKPQRLAGVAVGQQSECTPTVAGASIYPQAPIEFFPLACLRARLVLAWQTRALAACLARLTNPELAQWQVSHALWPR